MKVVYRKTLLSTFQLAAWAMWAGFEAGLLCACLLTMIDYFVGPPVWISSVLMIVIALFILPPALFVRLRHQIGSGRRAWVSGLGFGAGVTFLMQLIIGLMLWERNYLSALYAELGCLVFTFLMGLLTYAVWLWARHRTPRVVIQDGTLCSGCGYSLIGNISGACPECGRHYTHNELITANPRRKKFISALDSADNALV